MITNAAVIAQVENYIALVQANYDNNGRYLPNGNTFTFENAGQKYSRIIASRKGFGDQRSVHAFVDNDGLLYKAAGWKAPVREARWDLMNIENFAALAKVVSWSGGHLYVLKGAGQLAKGYSIEDRVAANQAVLAYNDAEAYVNSLSPVKASRPAAKSRKRVVA